MSVSQRHWLGRRLLTTDSGLFIFLEVVVDEAQNQGGLLVRASALRWEDQWVTAKMYLSYGSLAKKHQLDTAAGLGTIPRISHSYSRDRLADE